VLEIPEQLLFDDSSRARKIYLKHILVTISSQESEFLKNKLCDKKISKSEAIPKDKLHNIKDLLVYAPNMFLDQLESTLKEYKELTVKFRK